MTTTAGTGWPAALDALEEWVRRTAEGVAAKEPAAPGTAPSLPGTAVPADLRLRALQLVHTLGTVEEAVLRRRERVEQEAAYGAA